MPLVCTYLGSLPSLPESDRILDVGLRPLSGQVSRKVFRGIEDKAEVSLNYHGSYPFSEKENILLDGLKMILLTKLTARLREKEGGVYTPSVSVTREKRPVSLYNFQITFNCAPGNADRLIAAVNDEIDLLKTGGITTEDVHKFKMTEKGQFELRQRENGFWLAFIKSVYKGELSKNYVENYSKELDEVDTKDLQRAAQMYLNDDNLISVQLLPEKER